MRRLNATIHWPIRFKGGHLGQSQEHGYKDGLNKQNSRAWSDDADRLPHRLCFVVPEASLELCPGLRRLETFSPDHQVSELWEAGRTVHKALTIPATQVPQNWKNMGRPV